MKKLSQSSEVEKEIQGLKKTRGVTAHDITRYIVTHYNISEYQVKRKMYAALKKGVKCGLLSQHRGYYRLIIDNPKYIHEQEQKKIKQEQIRKTNEFKRLEKLKRRWTAMKQKC